MEHVSNGQLLNQLSYMIGAHFSCASRTNPLHPCVCGSHLAGLDKDAGEGGCVDGVGEALSLKAEACQQQSKDTNTVSMGCVCVCLLPTLCC